MRARVTTKISSPRVRTLSARFLEDIWFSEFRRYMAFASESTSELN